MDLYEFKDQKLGELFGLIESHEEHFPMNLLESSQVFRLCDMKEEMVIEINQNRDIRTRDNQNAKSEIYIGNLNAEDICRLIDIVNEQIHKL